VTPTLELVVYLALIGAIVIVAVLIMGVLALLGILPVPLCGPGG
jgi:hypothetical protein